MPKRISFAVALTLAAAACGSPTPPQEKSPVTPTLEITAGDGGADSIEAILPQALMVRVRGTDGALAPGVAVIFEAVETASGGTIGVAPLTGLAFGASASASSDARGEAGAQIQLGRRAGTATVRVRVPSFGLTREATFTVKPGNATSLVVGPRDTAVYVGTSYTLRAAGTDRRGNAVQVENLAFTTSDPGAAVQAGQLSATRERRYTVRATSGAARDSVYVSVLPRGTIAALTEMNGVTRTLVTFDLDGSEPVRRYLGEAYEPTWTPSGDRLFFVLRPTTTTTIGRIMEANLAQASDAAKTTLREEPFWVAGLAFTPDGAQLYYHGGSGIWRLPVAAGSTPVRLGPVSYPVTPAGRLSVAPFGGRVLFWAVRPGSGPSVYSLETNGTVAPHHLGTDPVYNPAQTSGSTEYAYFMTTALHVTTGSGQPRATINSLAGTVSWSRDGRWVIGKEVERDQLAVVEVATGLRIPLPFTLGKGYRSPVWRPAP